MQYKNLTSTYQRIYSYGQDYLICFDRVKPLYDIHLSKVAKANGKKLDESLSSSRYSSISYAIKSIDHVEKGKHSLDGYFLVWSLTGEQADDRAYARLDNRSNAEKYIPSEDTETQKPIVDKKPVPVKGVLADHDYNDFSPLA